MTTNKHGDYDQHVREPTHRAGQYSQPPIASEPAWNKGKHASQVLAGATQSLSPSFAGEPRQGPHHHHGDHLGVGDGRGARRGHGLTTPATGPGALQSGGTRRVETQGDALAGSVRALGHSGGTGRFSVL